MRIIAIFITAFIVLFCLPSCSSGGGTNDDTAVPNDVYSSLISLLEGEVAQLRAENERNEAEYSKKLAQLESLLAQAGKTDAPSSDTTTDTSEPSPFTYTVENGGAVITGYSGNYSVLVIPEKLGDYSVTAIADSVFSGNTKLTSVSIPSGVISLGWFAFSGCTSLKSVTIPDTVSHIGYDAFAYCKGITVYCASGSYAERYASSYGIGCIAS